MYGSNGKGEIFFIEIKISNFCLEQSIFKIFNMLCLLYNVLFLGYSSFKHQNLQPEKQQKDRSCPLLNWIYPVQLISYF